MSRNIVGRQHRRVDEVKYWMNSAGWNVDDDGAVTSTTTTTNSSSQYGDDDGFTSKVKSPSSSDGLSLKLKLVAAFIAVVVAIVVYQILASGKRKRKKKKLVPSSDETKASRVSRLSKVAPRGRQSSRSASLPKLSGSAKQSIAAEPGDYHQMEDEKEPVTTGKAKKEKKPSHFGRSKSRDPKKKKKSTSSRLGLSRSKSGSRMGPSELV